MKHIVVIADKVGGKNTALKRALILQKSAGVKITLLGFCYANINNLQDLSNAKLSRNQLEKKIILNRNKELDELRKSLKIKPSAITIKALWSKDIVQAVNAFCKKQNAVMVIKSANRSESFLYTSTDWQLIRECPVPVMIAAAKSWKKKPRILVALDFATQTKSKIKLNHTIMEKAQNLANATDQELHIVFAITVPQALVDLDLIDSRKYVKEKRLKLKATIDQFCQQYDIDSSRVHIRQGKPEKIIPSVAAKLKADVVVTGTVGRKGVKGKLLGNTAEKILSRLHTDIIAVKP
jgi:universal stress protein E